MTRLIASDVSPKPVHIPAHVAPRLDKHLLAYAAAASAAGVGLLAATQSAEAKIVYTAASMTIPVNTGLVSFDLNNDGIPDFAFYNSAYFGGHRVPLGLYRNDLAVEPSNPANEVWTVESQSIACAAALPAGVKIGPGGPFQAVNAPMFVDAGDYTNQFSARCPWHDKRRGAFLGLKFVINGQPHFGWAHVTQGSAGTVLNGYAYETVPNQPIHTGQTNGPSSATQSSTTPLPAPRALQRSECWLKDHEACRSGAGRKTTRGKTLFCWQATWGRSNHSCVTSIPSCALIPTPGMISKKSWPNHRIPIPDRANTEEVSPVFLRSSLPAAHN